MIYIMHMCVWIVCLTVTQLHWQCQKYVIMSGKVVLQKASSILSSQPLAKICSSAYFRFFFFRFALYSRYTIGFLYHTLCTRSSLTFFSQFDPVQITFCRYIVTSEYENKCFSPLCILPCALSSSKTLPQRHIIYNILQIRQSGAKTKKTFYFKKNRKSVILQIAPKIITEKNHGS